MKDAYSFDRDLEGLGESYRRMVEAYRRIFERCGLEFRVVEADPGLIGGDVNHEFMAPAEIGEDLFVYCTSCDYAANVLAASPRAPEESAAEPEPMEAVETPGRATIEAVSEFLGVPPERLLKCLIYRAGSDLVAVLVPGDREVDEAKLARAVAPAALEMLTDEEFDRAGLVKGFVGPEGLEGVTIIADPQVRGGANWVTGANKEDHHATGVNLGRDFEVDRWEDVTTVREGDGCPRCEEGTLKIGRAIEVGHTFQLGTRYSEPLRARFLDEEGREQPFQMGCYGIGVSRIVAAVVEQHHDDAGIVWPKAVAPYDVVVIPTNMDREEVVGAAESVYAALRGGGVEVVIDDRETSAGVKFADAELIGVPLALVVGARGLAKGLVEAKYRATGEARELRAEGAAEAVPALLAEAP